MSNVYAEAMTKIAGTIGQRGEMALRRVVQEVADKATGNFGATVGARRLSLEHHISDRHLIDYVGKHGTDAHLREAQGILNDRMKDHKPSKEMAEALNRHDRGWRLTADGKPAREVLPEVMSRKDRMANPIPTLTDKPSKASGPLVSKEEVRDLMFGRQGAKAAPEAAAKAAPEAAAKAAPEAAAKAAPEAAAKAAPEAAAKAAPETGEIYQDINARANSGAKKPAPAAATDNPYLQRMDAARGKIRGHVTGAVDTAVQAAKGTGAQIAETAGKVKGKADDLAKEHGTTAAAAGLGAAAGAGIWHLGTKLMQRAGKEAAPAVATTAKSGLSSVHPAALIGGGVVGGVAVGRATSN